MSEIDSLQVQWNENEEIEGVVDIKEFDEPEKSKRLGDMVPVGTKIYRDRQRSMKDKVTDDDVEVKIIHEFKNSVFIRSADLVYQGWVEKGQIV